MFGMTIKDVWLLILGLGFGVAGSAFANAFSPQALPWTLVVIALLIVVLLYVTLAPWKYPKGARAWSISMAVVGLIAIFVVYLITRAVYGNIKIMTEAINPVFPETPFKVYGQGFPTTNTKMAQAYLQQGGKPIDATVINATGDHVEIQPPKELPRGQYTLTVTGPLDVNLYGFRNRDTTKLTVLGAPVLERVAPSSGYASISGALLWGHDFDPRDDGQHNWVYFGSLRVAAHSGTQEQCGREECLAATVPPDAPVGKLKVRVETAAGRSDLADAKEFHVLGKPQIDPGSLQAVRAFPARGHFQGSSVTIRGEDFDPTTPLEANHMTVEIGGHRAKVLAVADNAVTVLVPEDPQDDHVVIDTPAGRAEAKIRLAGEPRIVTFLPQEQEPGMNVDIIGENFDLHDLENNVVTVGGSKSVVSNPRVEDGKSVLSAKVAPDAVDGKVVLETSASRNGGAEKEGFLIIPKVRYIDPKVAYIGDPFVLHAAGLMPSVSVYAAPHIQMLTPDGNKVQVEPDPEGGGQILKLVVPQGAETGPVEVVEGESDKQRTISHDLLKILTGEDIRLEEAYANVEFQTRDGTTVILRVQCTKDSLSVTVGGESPRDLPLGDKAHPARCPVDVDYDEIAHRAYTANKASHSISMVDLTDPRNPKHEATIDSGGQNPYRVKVLKQIFALTADGTYAGDPDRLTAAGQSNQLSQLLPSSERVVSMVRTTYEGGAVTLITKQQSSEPGKAYIYRYGQSPPRIVNLGNDPRSAAQARNKIYVANYASDNLSVFNPSLNSPPTLIRLPPRAGPTDMAENPKSHELLVPEFGRGTKDSRGVVAIVDTVKDEVESTGIYVGAHPELVGFAPSGCAALVFEPSSSDPSSKANIYTLDWAKFSTFGDPKPLNRSIKAEQALRIKMEEGPMTINTKEGEKEKSLAYGNILLADDPTSLAFSVPLPCPASDYRTATK